MQFEEGLGVKVFRIQAVGLLPDLFELILAPLQTQEGRWFIEPDAPPHRPTVRVPALPHLLGDWF